MLMFKILALTLAEMKEKETISLGTHTQKKKKNTFMHQ